ncbi:hypothetical protein M427DRAFT_182636 [Gonapodya prolifera JEL478]|uniref:Uncharacterized protein n=1 Tax=Gonapodya prolifera (strain JEL478) TaxID=1344416 RepID=A0A139A131_GONPJ|nr:hypothetical protein M427DRAFT_182636 [Gonapodya prolifera JEL478]|eukprot:KXS10328.1 hypothetical protein M427DRAFT_182636 [Gonapodya prolifera JEL478]
MKRKNREPESVESRGSGGEKAEASKKGGKKKRRRQEDEQQPAQGGNDHVPSTCTDSTCELCGDGELEISVVVRRDLGGGSVEYGGADDGDDLPSATDLLKLALSEKSVYERARDADYPLQRPGSGDDVRGARDPTRADRESHRALVQKLFETAQEVFDRGVSRDVTGQLRVATPTDLDAQRLRATCVRELGAFVRSGDVLDDAEKAYEEILEVAMPEGLASEDVARWESRKVEAWGGLWRTTMEKLMVKIEAFLPYANEESDSDEHETNPSQQHASGAAVWIDADEAKLVEKAIASLDKSITALPTDSNSAHLPRLLRESCAAARAMQEYWLASGGVSGRRAKRARGEGKLLNHSCDLILCVYCCRYSNGYVCPLPLYLDPERHHPYHYRPSHPTHPPAPHA